MAALPRTGCDPHAGGDRHAHAAPEAIGNRKGVASAMNNPYVPLLFLLAIGGGFAVFSVVAGALSGPKRYNRAKLDAYECGIEPTPQPPAAAGSRSSTT